MLLECINTSVWNLFIIPEEDWSQSKSIEEYEVNKLKNEDGYSCFYAFVKPHKALLFITMVCCEYHTLSFLCSYLASRTQTNKAFHIIISLIVKLSVVLADLWYVVGGDV